MILYDKLIKECLNLLDNPDKLKTLDICEGGVDWRLEQTQRIVFQRDMAYELGGNGLPALSGICFTSDNDIKDELILYGDDLWQIDSDTPYSRIVILNVDDSDWNENQQTYRNMQQIDYERYHIHPEGFMIRISTSSGREPVRVSRRALEKGLDFTKVGNIFLEAYHKHKAVLGAKIIFITDRDFPYNRLEKIIKKTETITSSLDELCSKLVMDCNICSIKPVCDEVEGMRSLHERQLKK